MESQHSVETLHVLLYACFYVRVTVKVCKKKQKKLSRDAIAVDISCLAKNIGDSANRTARHEWLQNKKHNKKKQTNI